MDAMDGMDGSAPLQTRSVRGVHVQRAVGEVGRERSCLDRGRTDLCLPESVVAIASDGDAVAK